jgi:hypothetical protein
MGLSASLQTPSLTLAALLVLLLIVNLIMGTCISTNWKKYHDTSRDEKARSDAIDSQIEEDSRKFRKEYKILLLGTYIPFYRSTFNPLSLRLLLLRALISNFRVQRIWEVDNTQADENHSPEWLHQE